MSRNPLPPERAPEGDDPRVREALDLWRDDVARAAARVDVHGTLADRVVAAARAGRPPQSLAGARWYAAAAVLLIAVGIAGTLTARTNTPIETAAPPRWAGLEETLVEVLADDPRYAPGLEGR